MTSSTEPPLVYVTFGTMFADDATLSVVVEAVRQLDVRVLVTVGPHGDPAALGDQPANVFVTRYVAQQRCCPTAPASCRTPGRGRSWPPSRPGSPNCAFPRRPTSSSMRRRAPALATGLVVDPGPVPVDLVRDPVRRLLEDGSFR